MESLRFCFVSFLVFSIVCVACRGDETTSKIAVEAMIRIEKWYSGLKSYDLEIETRKYHEPDELGKAITEASLSKEIFSAETNILTAVESSGSWILDLGNSGSSDVIKTVFRIGSATEGKSCPVPKECVQTFYEVVNCKKKATIKQTTKWKFLKHGDTVSVPTEEQLIVQGDELEKRVNK